MDNAFKKKRGTANITGISAYVPRGAIVLLFGLAILFSGSHAGNAQNVSQTSPDRGPKLGNAYSIGQFDTVNTTNGNLMLNFPLGVLPAGRGSATGGIILSYNSKLYNSRVMKLRDTRYSCDPEQEGPENCRYYYKTLLEPSDKGGWQFAFAYAIETEGRLSSYGENMPSCRDNLGGTNALWPEMTYIHKLRIVFPDGSTHEMHPLGFSDHSGLLDKYYRVTHDGWVENCGGDRTRTGNAMSYYSDDGSYLRLDFSYDTDNNPNNNTWTLYFPDGGKVTSGLSESGVPNRVYDRNGNYVEYGSIANYNGTGHLAFQVKDQLDRVVTLEHNGIAAGEDAIRSKGFDGADIVWAVKWKTVIVRKTYQSCVDDYTCPESELRSNLGVSFSVVDRITEPEQLGGHTYNFSYNGLPSSDTTTTQSDGWGEVSGVEVPFGAEIAYEYLMDGEDGPADINLTKDLLKNYPTTKTLTHDGDVDTWTYETGQSGSSTVEPDGSSSATYFTNIDENSWRAGLTYKTEFSNGTKVEKIWDQSRPLANCLSNPLRYSCNPYVKTEFTSIKDSTGSYALTAIKDFTYDKNGNLIEVREYDWMPYSTVSRTGSAPNDIPNGVPSGASSYLKRKTLTAYYNGTPAASIENYADPDPDSYFLASSKRLLRLPFSVTVQDASSVTRSRSEISYDYTDYDSSNTKAGNPNLTRSWDSTKNAVTDPLTEDNSISTSATYNDFGMPLTTTDANGVVSTVTYGNVSVGETYVEGPYPTQTEVASNHSALKRTFTYVHDFQTGVVTSTTDEDNDLTNATEYDGVARPIKAITAQGDPLESWTTTEYHDADRFVVVKTDLETKGDGRKVATKFFDQLGRVRLAKTLEDASTQSATNETDGIKVQTRYKTTSGYTYQLTSNPYRASTSSGASSEDTMGWTLSTAWSSGIRSEVQTFSGAGLPTAFGGSNTSSTGIVRTDIDADRTLVTDQAGKQRISRTNALGQLKDVWEVIPSSDSASTSVTFPGYSGIAYGYQTSYGYDTLNNLATVEQGSQERDFTYSSLSRLLSAANPESGTISYGYDPNGNLTSKTDARNVVTSYTYDALNRVTQRAYATPSPTPPAGTYQATPTVSYTYDDKTHAKGKLTKVSSSVSTTEYTSFDILGRVTGHKQTTEGGPTEGYTTTYTYKLNGALDEETYPSGRVVKNVLDANGDLATVKSKKASAAPYWTYANNFTYNAAGAVTSMELGNTNWESTVFNSRLQPTEIALGRSIGATDLLKLDYGYGSTGNNGNAQSQSITVKRAGQSDLVFDQTYAYDSLNRIQIAEEKTGTTTNWKQTFTFDRYGNRNFDEANTTTLPKNCGTSPNYTVCTADVPKVNPAVSTSNNRLTGYTFDAAGNVIIDADARTFTYDAENKQVEAKNASTTTLGTYYFDGDGKRVKKVVPSTGETTIFVYDAGGKNIAEYSTNVVPAEDAKVQYLTNDNLGTPRINTDIYGSITARHDYMPYGEEIVALGGRSSDDKYVGDDIRQGFTGYENDDETGLDYAKARIYSKSSGRFSSVDPLLSSSEMERPQTWNKYPYVINNPLSSNDPLGLYICTAGKTECEQFEAARLKAKDGLANIKNAKERAEVERAIAVYGEPGKDNGVTIFKGKTEAAAITATEGVRRKITESNPNGQNIHITISESEFGQASLYSTVVHEGVHAADGSEWVSHNFDEQHNPSKYELENRAYTAESLILQANGEGLRTVTISPAPGVKLPRFVLPTQDIWNPSWPSWGSIDVTTARQLSIDNILQYDKNYQLTSKSTKKAFNRGSTFK